MRYTRREFGRLAAVALPTAVVLPSTALTQAPKPNSKWAGVQVGMNVPYNFGGRTMPAEDVLKNTVSLGVSAVELRGQPIEMFLGAPVAQEPARGAGRGAAAAGGVVPPAAGAAAPVASGRGGGQSSEQQAATAALRRWRESASLDRAAALRRMYEDAGVLIEIVKWDGVFNMSDGELDYIFQLSKALGAKAISTEISDVDRTKRVGQFADKHRLFIGYHGHATTGAADYAAPFTSARFNGANVDIGHFIAGQNTSPAAFIAQHADRITHLHIKDRKLNEGPNTPFGQGDTPIREILQMMRDRKFTFQATIEFEYPVPEGSTRMAEIARALDYCRSCLMS
jgi:hypothetical protein